MRFWNVYDWSRERPLGVPGRRLSLGSKRAAATVRYTVASTASEWPLPPDAQPRRRTYIGQLSALYVGQTAIA